MFAGHVGLALGLSRFERRANPGVLVAAALLPDLLLWLLVIAGAESVLIPADFAARHQPQFRFPFSHGLLADLAWSMLAGAAAYACYNGALPGIRRRIALLVAAAVLSHWLLDALVHAPELPLAGAGSRRVGLGLWRDMPLALALECALTLAGLLLFLRGGMRPRGRSVALAALTILLAAFTVIGMTVAGPPPSAVAMAVSSMVTLCVVCALYAWLGRVRAREQT